MENHQTSRAKKIVKLLLFSAGLIGLGVLIGLYSGYKKNLLFQLAKSSYLRIKANNKTDATQGCNFSLKQFETSVDGKTDRFCFDDNPGSENLIINLHVWHLNSSNGGDKFLLDYARKKNIDYVLPNLGGHNRNPDACGSEWSIKILDQIISELTLRNGSKYESVIVIGWSGGGFTALNHMLRGASSVDHYISVVPITSLKTWFNQTRNTNRNYAEDIIECTNNLEFAEKRSPISYVKKITNLKGKLFLYHGVLDGYRGSVSAIHSIRFWNAINPSSQIPANQIIKIISLDFPHVEEALKPLYTFTSPFGEFILFNGGHTIPKELILERLDDLLSE